MKAQSPAVTGIALVAFDLDGVLVNTSPCHAAAYDALWGEMAVEGPAYETIAGRRTVEVVRAFADPTVASETRIAERVRYKQERARALMKSEQIVYEDAARCVRYVVGRGVDVALATGASSATATTALARLGLSDVFEIVLTAETVEAGKPDPEIYLRVASEAGVSPADVLVVEDSAAGLTAGLEAGAWVVSVRSGVGCEAPRCLGVYPDLDALRVDLSRFLR